MAKLHTRVGIRPALWGTCPLPQETFELSRCAILVLSALCLGLTSCAGKPEAVAQTYSVRGQVVGVSGRGAQERLVIHHEAIPDFRDAAGKTIGMAAMRMQFGLSAAVRGVPVVEGDKLEFAFETRWKERPAICITSLKKLPEATSLTLAGDGHSTQDTR